MPVRSFKLSAFLEVRGLTNQCEGHAGGAGRGARARLPPRRPRTSCGNMNDGETDTRAHIEQARKEPRDGAVTQHELGYDVLAANRKADNIASNTPGTGTFGYQLTRCTPESQSLILAADQPAP